MRVQAGKGEEATSHRGDGGAKAGRPERVPRSVDRHGGGGCLPGCT